MYSRILTASLYGLSGEITWAEVDMERGLPAFSVVGLANQPVKEAKERIHSAVLNCGYSFPAERITVNLTPANKKKDGSHYDLSIAMGVLLCSEQVVPEKLNPDHGKGPGAGAAVNLDKTAFLGELTLDGRVSAIEGALPMIIGLKSSGIETLVIGADNIGEAMLVPGLKIVAVRNLKQAAAFVEGDSSIEAVVSEGAAEGGKAADAPDFLDIKGQEMVKRAALVAACGLHALLMIGPPGVGKSMVGKRIAGILPALTYDDMLETTQVYSAAGLLAGGAMINSRPFRSPHHSISAAALVGGGSIPKPGEISLAHNGVLFLDELPEFSSHVLETLRQPLEDGFVTINRVNGNVVYPCDFMLVAAMNPCRCGYFGDPKKPCTCTETDRRKYIGKVSGPLLDRIDMHISMERVSYEELTGSDKDSADTLRKPLGSDEMRKAVEAARIMQQERYKGTDIRCNAQLNAGQIKKYCRPDKAGARVLETAYAKLNMSARAYHRILKVSRSIADLDGSETIKDIHLLEALSYRMPEKFFGRN